jgi:hypothetical protein
MRQRKEIADLVQEAINRGATTAEDIHKSIANLPLKMLEEISVLKKPVREVRKVQNRSIGAVYDLIRTVNVRVGKLASELLRERKAVSPRRKASSRSARGPHAQA